MENNIYSPLDREPLPEVGKTRLAGRIQSHPQEGGRESEAINPKRTKHAERRMVVRFVPHVLETQEENLAQGIPHDMAQPARPQPRNLF